MPKKKIKVDGGHYSLGAPKVGTTADGAVVTVKSVAYTVHGDSPITTVVSYPPENDGFTPYLVPSLRDLVHDAIESARSNTEAVIEAVNDEWKANVVVVDEEEDEDEDEGLREAAATETSGPGVNVGRAMSDLGVLRYAVHGIDEDEDEGLREGPVVGGSLGATVEDDVEAVPSIAELKRRRAFAEAVIAECKAAEMTGDTIRIPNAEYADLIAAKREGEYAAGLLDSFPRTYQIFLKSGVVTLRTTSEGHAALEAAIALLPVDAFWRRSCGTASDVSDSTQDDGGPAEPELDIDALVAAVDVQTDTCSLDIRALRSAEYPALTVTVTGSGSADLVRRILSEIHLPTLTEPLVNVRPVQVDVGEFATTSVDPVADGEAFRRAIRARI